MKELDLIRLKSAESEVDTLRHQLAETNLLLAGTQEKLGKALARNSAQAGELARRDAAGEPYGYVHKSVYENMGCAGLSNDHDAYRDSRTHIPLYTAAQPVVLPKKMTEDGAAYQGCKHGLSTAYMEGYNQAITDSLALGLKPVKVVRLPELRSPNYVGEVVKKDPDGWLFYADEVTEALDEAGVNWEERNE